MSEQFQPYFVAFAAAHGRTPAEQARVDDRRRTGKMLPFVQWMRGRWTEFDEIHGCKGAYSHTSEEHRLFGEWLPGRAAALAKASGEGEQ